LYFHVVCRGVRQEILFRSKQDFSTFLYIVDQLYGELPFELPSYCIMNNHYHFLIRTKSIPISKLMYLLNSRYALYFNNKYGYCGHVFEKNYYASRVYSSDGLLRVSKYIHLNPLKAQIVKKPEHYPWSSYSFYKKPTTIPPIYINQSEIFQYFNGDLRERRDAYTQFVEE
jgi:putative transposase